MIDEAIRRLAVCPPDGGASYGVGGDTYTTLIGGSDTAGRYALIDMRVPAGGGPMPHRHDFEEMFLLLDGQVEVWCGSDHVHAEPWAAVNVPGGVPHMFRNTGSSVARMLSIVAPAGLEAMFAEIGTPLTGRDAPAPAMDTLTPADRVRMVEVSARYGIAFLLPDHFGGL